MARRPFLVLSPIWYPETDFHYCKTVAGLLMWGTLWWAGGSVICNCCWQWPAQSSGLTTSELFYNRHSVYLGIKPPSGAFDHIFFINVRQLRVCWCRVPSLTRGWVCHLLCTMYNIFAFYMLSCIIHSLFIHNPHRSSLHSLRMDLTENTTYNSSSVVQCVKRGCCLAMAHLFIEHKNKHTNLFQRFSPYLSEHIHYKAMCMLL
jgi:hypothetical protein